MGAGVLAPEEEKLELCVRVLLALAEELRDSVVQS
jgi:hypothetical protein